MKRLYYIMLQGQPPRFFHDEIGMWSVLQKRATGWRTRREAEAVAFALAAQRPALIGRLSIEVRKIRKPPRHPW